MLSFSMCQLIDCLPCLPESDRALVILEGEGLRERNLDRDGEGLLDRSVLLHSRTSGLCEPNGSLILPYSVIVYVKMPSHNTKPSPKAIHTLYDTATQ